MATDYSETRRKWRQKNSLHVREYRRQWRKENPEKEAARRWKKLKTAYQAPPPGWFAETLKIQGGLCACCKSEPATCIDHCHTTGRVRGILCRRCNGGIGFFLDSPERLRNAVEYLECNQKKD